MKKTKLHFQTTFSKSTLKQISLDYKLTLEDEVLMAVWISDNENSIYKRKGFVITKNGFGWNYPAIAESTESRGGNKERVPRNSNYIEKSKVTFLGTNLQPSENVVPSNEKNEIQLRTSGTVYTFIFDSIVKPEPLILLEKAISSHFSDCFDLSVYEKIDDSYSLSITLITIRDVLKNFGRIVKEKLSLFKSWMMRCSQKIHSEETKIAATSTFHKIGAFFRHIIDLITDLILMFAVIIFAKPQLLVKDFLKGITAKISSLTVSIFYYDYTKEITKEIIETRNFIFIILVGLFLVLKILISLTCRKNRKAVTTLLLIMLIANFLLITDKFLVFLIFFLLILFALQFSMGFPGKVIGRKSVIYIFICIIGYLVLHIILYENFTELFHAFINMLALPVKWW